MFCSFPRRLYNLSRRGNLTMQVGQSDFQTRKEQLELQRRHVVKKRQKYKPEEVVEVRVKVVPQVDLEARLASMWHDAPKSDQDSDENCFDSDSSSDTTETNEHHQGDGSYTVTKSVKGVRARVGKAV